MPLITNDCDDPRETFQIIVDYVNSLEIGAGLVAGCGIDEAELALGNIAVAVDGVTITCVDGVLVATAAAGNTLDFQNAGVAEGTRAVLNSATPYIQFDDNGGSSRMDMTMTTTEIQILGIKSGGAHTQAMSGNDLVTTIKTTLHTLRVISHSSANGADLVITKTGNTTCGG